MNSILGKKGEEQIVSYSSTENLKPPTWEAPSLIPKLPSLPPPLTLSARFFVALVRLVFNWVDTF